MWKKFAVAGLTLSAGGFAAYQFMKPVPNSLNNQLVTAIMEDENGVGRVVQIPIKSLSDLKVLDAMKRANKFLEERPPAVLRRVKNSYQKFSESKLDPSYWAVERALDELKKSFNSKSDQAVIDKKISVLQSAISNAQDNAHRIRAEATKKAAQVPFTKIMESTFFENLGRGFKKEKISELEGKVVGIYFSAGWCGPCRTFSPRLVDAYNEAKQKGLPFEIVWVSWDRTEEEMKSYAESKGMNWLVLPFSEQEKIEDLTLKYDVMHIPMLRIIDFSNNGKVIDEDGRTIIENHGISAIENWVRKLKK
eukprot:c37303_g1_i1.p1 GENE.c37303_g1_i1~~c37303_g1_i1.p1  ORF type:complete len:307 (+),score=106.14 c37303_g1_i1:47-967(+)